MIDLLVSLQDLYVGKEFKVRSSVLLFSCLQLAVRDLRSLSETFARLTSHVSQVYV